MIKKRMFGPYKIKQNEIFTLRPAFEPWPREPYSIALMLRASGQAGKLPKQSLEKQCIFRVYKGIK